MNIVHCVTCSHSFFVTVFIFFAAFIKACERYGRNDPESISKAGKHHECHLVGLLACPPTAIPCAIFIWNVGNVFVMSAVFCLLCCPQPLLLLLLSVCLFLWTKMFAHFNMVCVYMSSVQMCVLTSHSSGVFSAFWFLLPPQSPVFSLFVPYLFFHTQLRVRPPSKCRPISMCFGTRALPC